MAELADFQINITYRDERTLALEHSESLLKILQTGEKALCILNRGYPSQELIRAFGEKGIFLNALKIKPLFRSR
jgi:hypothetical protein